MRKLTTVIGLVLVLALGLVAAVGRPQPARAAVDSVVLVWNEEALESVRKLPPGPTVTARALAVLHTAIYDAWAAYDPVAVGTRLGGSLRQPAAERTQANKERAVSFAAYTALVDLFPARTAIFDQRMTTLGYATDGSDASMPAMVGRTAAQAVLDFRHADGSNQLNGYADTSGYQPVNTWDKILDADRWQPLCVPTPPPGATTCAGRMQLFLTPHWRTVTQFALTSASQFRGPGPDISLTADGKPNGKYQDEVDKLTQHSKQLDDTRKIMAEYWADGPRSEFPPGHWNVFAQYVSRRDANSIDKDARMYFALNNALLDASITAWDGKRNWDSVRPITAVRWLMKGKTIQAWGGPYKGPSYIKGEDWIPYQPPNDPTPPFAEYTSGPFHLQHGRRRGPDRLHRPGQLRDDGHHPGRQQPGRAAHRDPSGGAGQADHAQVDQLPVRGRAGRQVTAVRGDPLRGRRQPRPRGRRRGGQTSLGQGPQLLQRHGRRPHHHDHHHTHDHDRGAHHDRRTHHHHD